MATKKAATPKPVKDVLARQWAEWERSVSPVVLPGEPPPEEGAALRIRAAFEEMVPRIEAGLVHATPEMRALFARVQAYVAAGLVCDAEGVEIEAALFAIALEGTGTHEADFTRRWVAAGGLLLAFRIALRATRLSAGQSVEHERLHVLRVLPNEAGLAHWRAIRVLPMLAPEIRSAGAQAPLRACVEGSAADISAPTIAMAAIALEDAELARNAVHRAEADCISFGSPWPFSLFEVLQDGETYAHLFGIGAARFQFFGAGELLRARKRLGEDVVADALVRVMLASLASPRPMQDTYITRFASVACAISHPWLAWLFAEHGKHKWLKKHAPLYAERHPTVTPAMPPAHVCAAQHIPAKPPAPPPGFRREELSVLEPEARDARLLAHASTSDRNAAFVVSLLSAFPSPALAASLHTLVHSPGFSTQMSRPGHHKLIQADLRAITHADPAMKAAVDAVKARAKKN